MPQRSRVVGGTVLITAIPTMDGITAGITIGIGITGIGRITANQQARFRLAFGRATLAADRPNSLKRAHHALHLLHSVTRARLSAAIIANTLPASSPRRPMAIITGGEW